MAPFVYKRWFTLWHLSCYDESSPCIDEQTAFCVIDIAKKADAKSTFPGQDKVVPWHICHFKNSTQNLSVCHKQVGIDSSEVDACLSDSTRMKALIDAYVAKGANEGSPKGATPYDVVDGTAVAAADGDPTYATVKAAICKADSSLSACSSVLV